MKVRSWWWRHNPLRRRRDVIEAWVLLGAWMLAVFGGLAIGFVAADAGLQSFDRLRVERHAVSAVLTQDAKDATSPASVDGDRVWTMARWHALDGSLHTGQTSAEEDARAGDHVTVWTDYRGAHVSAPPSHGEALMQAALLGGLTAGAVGGVVGAVAHVVWGRLMERHMEQWAVAWELADLRWGGRTG